MNKLNDESFKYYFIFHIIYITQIIINQEYMEFNDFL